MKQIRLLFSLVLLMAIPSKLFAYTDGQDLMFNHLYYRVISAADNTLAFLGTDGTVTDLVIPATIHDGADVTFTVTECWDYIRSFKSCKGVTSIVLPSTITKVESEAFHEAAPVTMNIPAGISQIRMFSNLSVFPKFTVDAGNENFAHDADGALYSKDFTILYAVPSSVAQGSTYTVRESVVDIRAAALFRTQSTKIIFPKNLTTYYEGYPMVVAGCTEYAIASGGTTPYTVQDGVLFKGNKLVSYPQGKATTAYTVPNGITEIAAFAITFTPLQTINFNQVVKLNASSLWSNNSIQTLTFSMEMNPATWGAGALEENRGIKEYKVDATNPYITVVDGIVYSKDMKQLWFYPLAKADASYNIPGTVEVLNPSSMQGASNLTNVFIPKSVKTIGYYVFRNCSNLANITFEEESQVEAFEYRLFGQCNSLKSITLPKSLKILDNYSLADSGIEVINVPDGSKMHTISEGVLTGLTNFREFNFLGSCELKTIGERTFQGLTKLTTFNIPASVTSIGRNAFSGCSSLTTATFAPDAQIEAIGAGAFANSGLTSISIPYSVKRIEAEAFANCNVLTAITLGENVNYLDPTAFKFNNKLADIHVDKKNTTYSSLGGILMSQDKETLVLFPPGKSDNNFTLLPPSITKIGDYAFYENTMITNVTIPNKVVSIGKRAFGLCTNLKSLTFLCDTPIPEMGFNQELNHMSIDDGTNLASGYNMFANIDIYVRKTLESQYKAIPYYTQFKSINTSFEDGVEEYIQVAPNTVSLLSTKTTDDTYTVPQTVTNNGTSYNVNLIGDYAFQNAGSNGIKEVVVKGNPEYIGAQAFVTDLSNNTSTIQSVFFLGTAPTDNVLSTSRFELDETGKNYNEVGNTTKVYVKKTALSKYTTAWAKQVYDRSANAMQKSPYDYTDRIDYKIPGVKLSSRYGTFAREFDVDLTSYAAENGGAGEVAAFVTGSPIKSGPGDFGGGEYKIRMESIDMHISPSGLGYGYVPAGVGVLIKSLSDVATPSDFFYTIGEADMLSYQVANNVMRGVTVNPTTVEASSASPIYVMQGGLFRKAQTNIANFPTQRAYLKADQLPANARILFVFDDGDSFSIDNGNVTGITTLETENVQDTGNYYDLQGRSVAQPTQGGVYIKNGKKVIIK